MISLRLAALKPLYLIFVILFLLELPAMTQSNGSSLDKSKIEHGIHNLDSSLRKWNQGFFNELRQDYDSLYPTVHKRLDLPDTCKLGNWVVYGFHPSYMKDKWKSYNFKLLSHVSYFSYDIDVETGGFRNSDAIQRWKTTAMIDSAQANSCRVDLTLTTDESKGSSRLLFQNEKAVDSCIRSVTKLLELRKAHGVCIDIEDVSSKDTQMFLQFLERFKKGLIAENPNYTMSVTFGPLKPFSPSDVKAIDSFIDYYIIMGYNYSWKKSSRAGPVAPIPPYQGYNLESSVDKFLSNGIAKEKLVLALPYYGYEWETKGADFTSKDVRRYESVITFHQLKKEIEPYYRRKWESAGQTSYFVRKKYAQWHQVWIPDSAAMALRFQLVKDKEIAGTGMWSLGMDNGYNTLWELLHQKFGQHPHPDAKIKTKAGKESGILGDIISFLPMQNIRWGFAGIVVILFAILTLLLVFNRKLQQEIFNRFNNHFLFALLSTVLAVLVLDFILQYISGIPFGLSLAIAIGIGLVLLGYIRGQKAGLEREDKN